MSIGARQDRFPAHQTHPARPPDIAAGGEAADGSAASSADSGSVGRRPRIMIPGGGSLAIVTIGLVLGLTATALVVSRGWDPAEVAVGPWMARPQIGSPAIDPYARADLAHSGRLPLATSEGLAFRATTDDTGYRLVRNCVYRVAGVAPPARAWTMTASSPDGRSAAGPADRTAFTSSEVVRSLDGRFTIVVAKTARPGNWLPVAGDGPLTLWLRLYDTPLAGNSSDVAAAAMPTITRLSCAAPTPGLGTPHE